MTPTVRALVLAIALGGAALLPAIGSAAVIRVTTTADTIGGDGLCSLREAVIRADTDVSIDGECNPGPAGADTIVLGPGTFRLTRAGRGEDNAQTGDLDLKGPVEIVGVGTALTILDGASNDRVLDVLQAADVTVRDLTITGGRADPGGTKATESVPAQGTFGGAGTPGACGGGIAALSATLRLSGVVVTGNAAGAGGPGATVTGPTSLIGRGGDGGPGGAGGGICAFSTPTTLTRSAVSGNRAGDGGDGGTGFGGLGLAAAGGVGAGGNGGDGIGGQGGSGGTGGGIGTFGVGALVVDGSTITGNRAGDGGDAGNGSGGDGGGGNPVGPQGPGYGNQAGGGGSGGGIGGNTTISVTRSTLAGNTAGAGGLGGVGVSASFSVGGDGGPGGDGGGLRGTSGPQGLVNVTVARNIAGSGGGAGAHSAAPTVVAGRGGRAGRGGGLASDSNLSVVHATIVDNGGGRPGGDAPGAVSGLSGAPGAPGVGTSAAVWSNALSSLTRSILSGNSCETTSIPIDDALNIAVGSPGCPGAAVDPRLGPLGDNGGPATTMRPLAGSAAIDRIPAGPGCPATDARGALRPSGTGCDVGAFEVAAPSATTGGASAVGATSASVTGTIDTRGLDTGYRVEFGTTASYGRQVVATAAGAAAPSAIVAGLTGLFPSTTYHYRLTATGPDGAATGADRTFTTTAATIAGGPGSPRITRLTITPRRFAVVPRGGSVRRGTRARTAVGARVAFRLTEAARVTVIVQRTVAGRRVRRAGSQRCVAVRSGARVAKRSRCVLHPAAGTLRAAGRAGANSLTLTGRFGRRALAPGPYRVVVTAVDPSGARSLPSRAAFTVVTPAR